MNLLFGLQAAHQRRGDYWRHGSVCEDYAAIECPTLLVGGWLDGYVDGNPERIQVDDEILRDLLRSHPSIRLNLEEVRQRTAHERLIRVCFSDYDRDLALIVEHEGRADSEILGVGRLSKLPGQDTAEFAIVIAPEVYAVYPDSYFEEYPRAEDQRALFEEIIVRGSHWSVVSSHWGNEI